MKHIGKPHGRCEVCGVWPAHNEEGEFIGECLGNPLLRGILPRAEVR